MPQGAAPAPLKGPALQRRLSATFPLPAGVDTETTFLSKPIKALILATGRAVCLYKARGRRQTAGALPAWLASLLAWVGA